MDRKTSRRYGVEFGTIKLSTYDLQLIRDHAITALKDEQGCDVARAWVTATIGYLIKEGHLRPVSPVKATGETV